MKRIVATMTLFMLAVASDFGSARALGAESTTLYVNPTVGIELRYSSVWSKKEENKTDGTLLLLKTKTNEKFRVRTSMLDAGNKNLDAYVDVFLNALKKKHTVISSKKTMIQQYPAYTLMYSFTPSSKNPKHVTRYVDTIILRDRTLLSMTYFGFPTQFNASYKDAKAILSSVRFTTLPAMPKKECDPALPKEWQEGCAVMKKKEKGSS